MFFKHGSFRGFLDFYIVLFFLHALLLGAIVGKASGASEEERSSQLMEKARSEGKVVLYSIQTITDSARVIKKFEEKYPFLKVELYRATSPNLQNKIITEAKARKYIPDVIEIPGFNAALLKKERLYASYVSPENRAYPEGFKDPDGNWTSTYILPYLMGYNTKLLTRKDIPDTYEGFLHPRWKGKKIGFDTIGVEWFANMLKIMGEEKGMDFFKKLAAQRLSLRAGHALITDLVIAGEFPVGTVYPQQVDDRRKKGAPIDWVAVAPVIAKLSAIGLAAHANHPNAAKLYIDFTLSKEGQMVTVSNGRMPARPDMDADIFRAFQGVKIHPSDIALADKFSAYSRQFAEVLK